MSDYASQLVAAKMQTVNSRISARMQQISAQTGVDFSSVLRGRVDDATAQATQPPVTAEPATIGQSTVADIAAGLSGTVNSRNNYDQLISETAGRYAVETPLLRAVVWAESNFNTNATSKAGAMGLMQLMPDTAALLGCDDAYDPAQNLDAGAKLLSDRIASYNGDVRMALASYNCGAGGLSSRDITNLSDPEQFSKLPAETQTYLTRIEGYLEAAGATGLLSPKGLGNSDLG